ncbi:hypothetical protein AALT_g3696 [Alternaria alternata]|nr:hypothetical protein AALT_g3696 [Alternaria alternata]
MDQAIHKADMLFADAHDQHARQRSIFALPGECGERPPFRRSAEVHPKLPDPQNAAGGKEQPQRSAWLMHAATSSRTERRERGQACHGIQTATIAIDDAKSPN